MIQFQTYLRSELGKLSNPEEARDFLDSVDNAIVRDCGLPTTETDLAARLPNQSQVDIYVAGLPTGQLISLSTECGRWRNSNVYEKLSRPGVWHETEASVDDIDVQEAEHHLKYLWERNGYHLAALVLDPELSQHEPYKSPDLEAVVAFPIGLGERHDGRYHLFDGVHRTILLARRGERTIWIIYRDA